MVNLYAYRKSKSFIRPKSESEKKNLLRETFLSPKLYKGIYERFKGKPIPDTLQISFTTITV